VSIARPWPPKTNEARVRASTAPLLVLVGSRDDITPPPMSRRLWTASPAPESLKRLVELPGANHENVLQHADFAAAYGAFMATVVRGRAGREEW
jgi:uncharacterized protein